MYSKRINEHFILASFERPLVSALLGARRVGKTTLVNHYVKEHPERKWVTLNMDRLEQRSRVENNELAYLIQEKALARLGGEEKVWVVIDEAQKCPPLFEQIKIIYDDCKGKDKVKFIITGSAHLNLHQLSAESLAGRVELLNLREFNVRETTRLQNPNVKIGQDSAFQVLFEDSSYTFESVFETLQPFNHLFNQAIETHLIWGGLPEVLIDQDHEQRWRYLGDYLQTYLETDVRSIESITNLNLYRQLIKIIAEQTGSLRDDKKIIDALGCARNTLNKYRSYLEATLQYSEIYPYINSTLKRLVKAPKSYLNNNGLISYLTGIRELPMLKTTGLIGHRFETWFLQELQTWQDKLAEYRQVCFWRTASGVEVDFVAILGKKVIPFEITYSKTVKTSKVSHLLTFMNEEPKAQMGVYVYMGDLKVDQKNKIVFLPAWML